MVYWFIGYAAVLVCAGQFISIASKSETSNHNLFLLPSLLLDAGWAFRSKINTCVKIPLALPRQLNGACIVYFCAMQPENE
jgi:hypothetical protein